MESSSEGNGNGARFARRRIVPPAAWCHPSRRACAWPAVVVSWIVSSVALAQSLQVEAKTERLRVDRIETASVIRTVTPCVLEVLLNNLSSAPFQDVVVEYKVFIRASIPGARPTARVMQVRIGKIEVPTIDCRKSVSVRTPPFELNGKRLKPGWTYTNQSTPRTQDSLAGYAVIVRDQSGMMIGHTASAPEMLARWDEVPEYLQLAAAESGLLPSLQAVTRTRRDRGGAPGGDEAEGSDDSGE